MRTPSPLRRARAAVVGLARVRAQGGRLGDLDLAALTERDQLRARAQRVEHGAHEQVQVGKQRRQSRRQPAAARIIILGCLYWCEGPALRIGRERGDGGAKR